MPASTASGLAQSLTHLMNGRLGQEGHAHLSITDVEIEGPGPLPAKGLVELKKFFDMPALWIMDREILDFVSIDGREKRFKIIILRPFSVALNKAVIRLLAAAVAQAKGFLGRGITGPAAVKALRVKGLGTEFGCVLRWHRDQQFKRGLQMNVINQFGGVMLAVG